MTERGARRRTSGLDEPMERGLGPNLRPQYDPEVFGRISERIARRLA